jgi:predicted phosphodiesterase
MKLLVVSDLHAFTSDSRRAADGKKPFPPSFIDFSAATRGKVNDPLVGLQALFQEGKLKGIDCIIVAGDIGDKADPVAIRSAWTEMHSIAQISSVKVFATCGNHDLDTRHKTNRFDPRGFLRTLQPSFPVSDLAPDSRNHLEYWANNFTLLEEGDCRILNINSCAFHGYGDGHEKELEHGRISDITLELIEDALRKSNANNPSKHNICLVHHHVKPVSSDDFEDTSTIKGAEKLTDLLSKADFGEWLVIHGHRHRPNLFCAGGNTAPFILSCGSFAATRNGDEHNLTPNQFYVVQLDPIEVGRPARASGVIQTWNWTAYGWTERADIPGGLPSAAGFGYRGRIPDLADRIRDKTQRDIKVTRRILMDEFPEYLRLIPNDLTALIYALERQGIIITYSGREIEELVAPNV